MSHEPVFVGREAEIERLDGFLSRAINGQGGTCFVTGEPGAGKSTLLAGFSRRSEKIFPDIRVAMGDCNPQTGLNDAYLPFREILSRLTTQSPDDGEDPDENRKRGFFSGAARVLSEHGPDLVDIFLPGAALVTRVGAQAADRIRQHRSSDESAMASRQLSEQGRLDQNHIFEQYTNVLVELAAERPMILVVDDLHWADDASTRLLFHLSRRLAGHRVLLIGAYRANEVAIGRDGERHPLEEPLNEIKRYQGDVWVDLQQSQEAGGRDFVDQLLDAEPNRLGPEFREELFRHTRGHALFTAELLHFLKDREILIQDANGAWTCPGELAWSGLPARVDGVISERVARLDGDQRTLLALATVLGESFAAEVLAELAGRDLREVVRELSGPLTRQHALTRPLGFQRLGGKRLSNYEFRHNLIHRYFQDEMDQMEWGMLHEDAGLAIEKLFEDQADQVAVQLARHFSIADLPDKAVPYLLMAGREAKRSCANRAAREFFNRTLRMLGENPGLDEHDRSYAGAIEALGDIQVLDGEFSEARERYQEAQGLPVNCERMSQVRLLRKVATTREREHQHDQALESLEMASRLLEEGFQRDDTGEMSAWITLRNAQLWLNYWRGNTDEMARLIRELEPVIETHGNPSQRRRFHTSVCGYGNRLDRFAPSAETLAAARRARAAAEDSDALYDQADGLFGSSFVLMLAGELDEAFSIMSQSLEMARRCGDRTQQARTKTYLAVLSRMRGDAAAVARWVPEATQECDVLGMREYTGVLLGCESWLAWQENDLCLARELADQALAAWQEHAPGYPFRWLAAMQLLDIDLREGSGDEALSAHLDVLLGSSQARLINGVSEQLEAAASALASGDQGEVAKSVDGALEAARSVGYL